MSGKLDGKVVVVTGAGSGMGRAMAELFAEEGASVIVSDIVAERVDEVVATINDAGGAATGVVANVAEEADVDQMIDTAVETYGTLDILVNNAGIMDRMTPVAELTNELWERVLSVNLTGAFLASRKALSIMLKKEAGVILNIASVGGLHGGRAGAAYTASKHGLVGLTKNIAYMYATSGIRCNAICPGGVETNIGIGGEPNQFGYERMGLGAATMPRAAKPREIATLALALVSDDGSFVNGATVVADAGWTAY